MHTIPKENLEKIKTTIFEAIESGRMPAYMPGDGRCMYRDGDGNACGYGALVPDDSPHLQDILDADGSIYYLKAHIGTEAVCDVPALEGVEANDIVVGFLHRLQGVHDNVVAQNVDFTTREGMKQPLRDAYHRFFKAEEARV